MKITPKKVIIALSLLLVLVAALVWLVFFKMGVRFQIGNIVTGGN
jgi:hypothetical protein